MTDNNFSNSVNKAQDKVAKALPASDRFYNRLAIADWITAAVLLVFGLWQVIASWPSPEWWAWLSLGLGIAGIPIAALNPGKRLNKWVMRRAVKKR